MAERTVVEAVNDALTLEMARDDRVLVFGEDVGVTGGVFRATEGLFTKYGKEAGGGIRVSGPSGLPGWISGSGLAGPRGGQPWRSQPSRIIWVSCPAISVRAC